MNRKLRNTFAAVMACSVLVLGVLFAASPALFAEDVPAPASPASAASARFDDAPIPREADAAAPVAAMARQIDPRVDSAATLADTLHDIAAPPVAVAPPRHKSGKSSRVRQSMVMPFFSFAPRG